MTGEEKWDPDEALAFLMQDDDLEKKVYCGHCDAVWPYGHIHCGRCGTCKPHQDFPKWGNDPKLEKRFFRAWRCKVCRNKGQKRSS